MDIIINYWAVLVCAVLAMVVGSIWYGPLFGKKWMEIIGATGMSEEEKKASMQGVWKLYLTNFVLVLFQLWVLSFYILGAIDEMSGLSNALWIWAGFVLPTLAAGSMWNNEKAKLAWSRFLIQSGYQLVMFVIFGLILTYWR